MWQLTEVSKVAIDMVGLFGSNKVKKSVDISQRTGGKVRSRLVSGREQVKQDRAAEKDFRHVATFGDID